MVDEIHGDAERRMQKSVESVTNELGAIRSGKASPAFLDNVKVEAYGQKQPLNQIASVSIPDPMCLVVQPWDKSILGDVVKAIQSAELGFNPQIEANILRFPIPPLSEERRLELVKLCKKIAEDGKVAIRNVRRDANDKLKKAEKDKQISEDDQRKGIDRVQKSTDKFIKDIDDILAAKEKELMSI